MKADFEDKNGNLLGVNLYNFSSLTFPLFFQGYKEFPEGDSKLLKAIFQDYNGNFHPFSKSQVSFLATPVTSEEMDKYIQTAKSLIQWLSSYSIQSQLKPRPEERDILEERCCPDVTSLS